MPDLRDVPEQWPVAESHLEYDGGGWVVRLRNDRIRRPGHPEDEPFSRLDAALRQQVRGFVFEHVRQRAIPVLLVTHDRDDIADPARVIDLGQHA